MAKIVQTPPQLAIEISLVEHEKYGIGYIKRRYDHVDAVDVEFTGNEVHNCKHSELKSLGILVVDAPANRSEDISNLR